MVRSLKAVLSYPEDGSIADILCLTFVDTVASSQKAGTTVSHDEDMIPGGADVPVTDVNKHQCVVYCAFSPRLKGAILLAPPA